MSGMPLTEDRAHAHEGSDYVGATVPKKIPTGISALDSIVDGGLPSGSTVLLLSDPGAGGREFGYTAAAKLSLARTRPLSREWLLGRECRDSHLPRHICYITYAHSRDAVLQEFQATFNLSYYQAFLKNTVFKDLSAPYFRNTPVPSGWALHDNPFEGKSEGLLEGTLSFLDENAGDTVVIVDSLTDLVESKAVEESDLIAAVKGITREGKTWDGLVYLMLTHGIADAQLEQSLIDSVDGCIAFTWRNYLNSSKRQRYMQVDKFTAVLPHLAEKKIARFPVRVMSREGLVVDYLERIS